MLLELIRVLFSVFLMAGVPALSWRSARPAELREIPKTALYLSALVSQWVLAAVGAAVVVLAPLDGKQLGFRMVAAPEFLQWTFLVATVSALGLGFFLLLEHWGWWPEESEMVRILIPESFREKLWALLGMAPTAGVCEEFLYRGFLLVVLTGWFHSVFWGVVISSLAFGLAHVYQGLNGVLRAALLGALLAYPVLLTGSLYPSMAAHFLIDAVALLWLGPRFVARQAASGVASEP